MWFFKSMGWADFQFMSSKKNLPNTFSIVNCFPNWDPWYSNAFKFSTVICSGLGNVAERSQTKIISEKGVHELQTNSDFPLIRIVYFISSPTCNEHCNIQDINETITLLGIQIHHRYRKYIWILQNLNSDQAMFSTMYKITNSQNAQILYLNPKILSHLECCFEGTIMCHPNYILRHAHMSNLQLIQGG